MSQHTLFPSEQSAPAHAASGALSPALVVYNHNGAHTLPALLAALKPVVQIRQAPLLVVDDASSDSSPDFLKSQSDLDFLLLPERAGVGAALNQGFARFAHRDVIRLYSHVLPQDAHWLDSILQAAAALPQTGVLGVRLITPDGRILSEGRRLVTGLGLNWQEADRLYLNADRAVSPTPVEVDSVAGDLAFYRRAALDAVGGLDVGYWPHGLEDDDFCFATRACGFDVHVLPDVRALCLRQAPLPEGARVPALEAALAGEVEVRKLQAEYWAAKWGWDPLVPDLGEVRRLYGHSRVCWATGEVLRWSNPDPLPAVDLCMVTWNGAANLERCLNSLACTDYPADRLTLYLVDNASTDATPEILPRLLAQLPFATRLIRLDVNTGGVVGLNWAFAQGHAPLLAKLDDDIVLAPDWLRRMADVFRRRPYAGVVGPRIVDDTPAGRIQCADYAYYPVPGGREMENDDGSAACLARVTHVRGCCNVYRRDVLKRCGPLDIRFSPSQWDDPDHHMALLTAGYEVIYDGSVRVAHKCVTGAAGGASLGHATINKAKMLLKWGPDSPQVLECALLLSREGRFLPDSGQSDVARQAPVPAPFPRQTSAELKRHMKDLAAHIPGLIQPPAQGRTPALIAVLGGTARQLVAQAADSRAMGQENAVGSQLRAAVSCAPHDPLPLLALADVLEDAGVPADNLRSRARLLRHTRHPKINQISPLGQSSQLSPSGTISEHPDRVFPHVKAALRRTYEPAGLCSSHPVGRVLFCLPHRHRFNEALGDVLDHEARRLCEQGYSVHVTADQAPPAGPWDIAHFWTLDTPHETLLQMKAMRCASPATPRVLSPLWRNVRGQAAATLFQALREASRNGAAFLPEESSAAQENQDARNSGDTPDAPLMRRLVLELTDALLLFAREEADLLRKAGTLPPSVACNGVRSGLCDERPCDVLRLAPLLNAKGQAGQNGEVGPVGLDRPTGSGRLVGSGRPGGWPDPQMFKDATGLNTFVLAVAPFHPLANQAVLLAALAPLEIPLVLIGSAQDREYLLACRHLGTPRTLFVSEVDDDLLASAFAGATVYALPQLGLPGLVAERAALQAALYGKPVVAAAHGPEQWLLGRLAPGCFHPCNPLQAQSVREAVLKAAHNPVPEAHLRRLTCLYATESFEAANVYAHLRQKPQV